MKGHSREGVRAEYLLRFSQASAAAAGLCGVVVLGAWALSYIPGAAQLGPNAMNPLAGFLFIVSGFGFLRAARKEHAFTDTAIRVCALIVLTISVVKALEMVFGAGPFVDQFLFSSKVRARPEVIANVLAPNTVLNFILCGTGLLALDVLVAKRFRPAQPLFIAAFMVSLLALVGYGYQVMGFYNLGSGTPMAWSTAAAFLFLCAAALTVRPTHGIMGVINSETTGGAMARRLLPMAILIPWGLGMLRWAGECRRWYETQMGVALFTVSTMAVFSALVWWNAKLLHKADLKRRHAEERLRRIGSNLERSNADLQQFAYVASHDLSEPLRMITSYLQLLEQTNGDKLDDRGREFISFAIEGARRMRALITDLLAYSRVDATKQVFETVDCNLAAANAVSNLKIAMEEAQAQVRLAELPHVKGDFVQLTQLFQNLIGNALKFRGSKPPVIEISASLEEKLWVVAVKDNGIGIKPQHFKRIFEIFQRLHTRAEYPGTGMGLAICKRIVERHGGRIWVESQPDQGSTFKFTLPAHQRHDANE